MSKLPRPDRPVKSTLPCGERCPIRGIPSRVEEQELAELGTSQPAYLTSIHEQQEVRCGSASGSYRD
jgi:hypothetical protein